MTTEADRAVLKQAIKNTGKHSSIKNRIVDSKLVAKFQEKINEMANVISSTLEDEKEESLIAKTEKDYTRAVNMLEHREEIVGRPRREWFQSQDDKKLDKTLGKRNHDKKDRGMDGLSRKKKRMRMACADDDKSQIKAQSVAARASKKSLKPSKISMVPKKSGEKNGKKKGKSLSLFGNDRGQRRSKV